MGVKFTLIGIEFSEWILPHLLQVQATCRLYSSYVCVTVCVRKKPRKSFCRQCELSQPNSNKLLLFACNFIWCQFSLCRLSICRWPYRMAKLVIYHYCSNNALKKNRVSASCSASKCSMDIVLLLNKLVLFHLIFCWLHSLNVPLVNYSFAFLIDNHFSRKFKRNILNFKMRKYCLHESNEMKWKKIVEIIPLMAQFIASIIIFKISFP